MHADYSVHSLLVHPNFSFPINEDNTLLHHPITPTILEPSTHFHALSKIELLPFEILVDITSRCPLSTLICLPSTSHHMRSKLLALSSDRDYIACTWIKTSAPWYEIHLPEEEHPHSSSRNKRMGWLYLQRCVHTSNGSMMNRKRIWGIAEQLERKAINMGI